VVNRYAEPPVLESYVGEEGRIGVVDQCAVALLSCRVAVHRAVIWLHRQWPTPLRNYVAVLLHFLTAEPELCCTVLLQSRRITIIVFSVFSISPFLLYLYHFADLVDYYLLGSFDTFFSFVVISLIVRITCFSFVFTTYTNNWT
jgi:hypothetical protein